MKHLEAGQGVPVVDLQLAGQLRLAPVHTLLARGSRVIALETSATDPAALTKAIDALGIDRFHLMATAATASTALALAALAPARVITVVLEAPGPLDAAPSATLDTPVLVLLGTTDETAPAIGRAYKERLGNAHLVYVYDAGREIAAQRPEAVAEVVIDFLERGEAFVISRSHTLIHP